MSGDSPHLNKVLKGKAVEGPLRTTRTLRNLVNILGMRTRPTRIITSGVGVLVVVGGLEMLEALCPGIVDILGEGDERGKRSRSVGDRHFNVEDRLMVQGATATTVVVSS